MPLDPKTKEQVAARLRYYREMGVHDFYRRKTVAAAPNPGSGSGGNETDEPPVPKGSEVVSVTAAGVDLFAPARPEAAAEDNAEALRIIREDLGDCTRCVLHRGRTNLVFGVGNPSAELMFVGEGPGADEDIQGEPFVGRAGQLLNKMIAAMGLRREDVYIANVVKCRPPGNRAPERDEADTCSPFLLRQIDVIRPKVIVALGAVAAKNLLGINDSMANLRGRWYDFRGMKLAVTYHPAFLLRDPRQKGEAWKDLQLVMKVLGLKIPKKQPE